MWGEVVSTSQGCQTLVTLWIVAHQATLSMGFPRQDTGVGCHFLLQGIFLTQDQTCISCVSCIGRLTPTGAAWEVHRR